MRFTWPAALTAAILAAVLHLVAQRGEGPVREAGQTAAARTSGLATLSPERHARLAREKEHAERETFSQPDRATEFHVNSRTGPILTRGPEITTGARTLDPARYLPALAQMRDMPRYDSATGTVLPPRAAGDPDQADTLGTWTVLGPANQGGRTRALLIDPNNPSVMYAGGVAGGVWKSTDAGASWAPLTDLMANIAVSTLAFDPQDSSVIYAGTGEGFYNGDAIRGAGIFRSTNAGLTWSQIASTNNASFHYTNRVIVSPRNSQRIFAATRAGLYRSVDGGGSWTSLAVTVNGGCTDMALQAQGASGYVFVSCGTFAQANIYRVQDDDTAVPQGVFNPAGMGRSAIAVAPSNEAIVYVLGSQYTNGGGPGTYGLHGVYRSTANGDPGTFTTQRQGNVAPVTTADRISQLLLTNPVYGLLADCGFGGTAFYNQGWYDNVIAVDPVDPLRVWAGGIDLWRSDNGGVDWGTAGYWWFDKGDAEYHHADQHGIVFHPQYNGTSNKVMFATSDGGVDRIDDARAAVNTTITQLCGTPVTGGATWVDRNAGYVTTQFYDGVPYPNGQTFFGGLQDNGTQRGTTGGLTWNILLGGDGGYVAVDTLGDVNAANDVLFGEFTNLSLQRSINGGLSFSNATSGITESSSGFLFIAPFTMNPATKQQLWTGGYYIWRTTNQATSWTRASALTAGNGSVAAIAAHPLDGNRVLAAMSDGYIHYTTTGLTNTSTTTWPNARPTSGYVSWVAWDPNDLNTAYATVSTFSGTTLFKTINGGAAWSPSMGSGVTALPQVPALSVVVNPADSQEVFVGTDLGVFVSIDGGASWLLENAGFATVPVESLKFNETAPRRLFAFTHGRGAWRVTTGCPAITLSPASLPGGTVGAAYSQALSASGGTGPYSYLVVSGELPTGMALSSGGSITGTPTGSGTYNLTIRATDANTCLGTQAYSIEVAAGLPAAFDKTAPANGATSASTSPTLSWAPSSGATSYEYCYDTTNDNACSAWTSAGTNTSVGLSGLGAGATYYWHVRASNTTGPTYANGSSTAFWSFTTSASTAELMTPAGTLTSSTQTFAWTAGVGVTQYWLQIGTTGVGSFDLVNRNGGTSLSTVVAGLPTDGRTLYVRLWSNVGGAWLYRDHQRTALTDDGRAWLTTPAPGQALIAAAQTFAWAPGTGATQYWLHIGTTGVGSFDLVNRNGGTSLSTVVTGLPTDGRTLYVRLWSNVGGAWLFRDYQATTLTDDGRGWLIAPAPGLTLAAATHAFTWAPGTGATQYWLHVGTTGVGSFDLVNRNQGPGLSAVVTGLPTDGRTVFVRLWSHVAGTWRFRDYDFASLTDDGRSWLTAPAPSQTLSAVGQTFTWTAGTGVSQHWLHVGTTGVGSLDLVNRNPGTGLSTVVTGLPTDGRTLYVRLWSNVGGTWGFRDYEFVSLIDDGRAWLTTPIAGQTLASVGQTFSWTPGTGVTQYWLHVGTTGAGSWDLVNRSPGAGPSTVVTGLPTDGRTLFVRLWSNVGGTWRYRDSEFASLTDDGRAWLTSPVPGQTLSSATETFTWTAGAGVTQFWLHIGTTGVGSFDLVNRSPGAGPSTVVTGLPTDGRTLYVRLWSNVGGTWRYRDAQLVSVTGG